MSTPKKIPKSAVAPAKDTVYIDIDDEITAIIEKVRASSAKIVALVLPKRTTTLKSIVNLRLLKRTADDQKKNLVLITSEASILPLAGAVGMHVAKTLQSKPVVPPAPEVGDSNVNLADDALDAEDVPIDSTKPIGELANLPEQESDESIEVDSAAAAAGAAIAEDKAGRQPFNKKLKVPNFEKFRLRFFLITFGLILLLIGWLLANSKLTKAVVSIKTDSQSVNSDVTVQASTKADSVDKAKMIVPAQLVKANKSDSATAPTTGQKDKGNKASGNVTLTLKDCSQDQVIIYAGTAVSTGGLTFITQSTVTLNKVEVGSNCNPPAFSSTFSKDVKVVAQAGGTKYNIDAGKTFTVAGAANVSGSNGAAISGGTSDIVKVVAQADIDSAKKALTDKLSDTAKDELAKQAKDQDVIALEDSFTSKDGALTLSAKVGDEASEVKVSGTVTFSMTAIKQDDIDQIIKADAQKHIDTSSRAISDTGLDSAVFKITNKKSNGDLTLEVQTTVTAGAHLDDGIVKGLVGGKKKGEAQSALSSREGVKEVHISLSPFWATKIPNNSSKIIVKFEQVSTNASTSP